MIKRAWDIQRGKNWWFSLGFHVDHTDPSITYHLPGIIIAIGRLKQPGFRKTHEFNHLIKGDKDD